MNNYDKLLKEGWVMQSTTGNGDFVFLEKDNKCILFDKKKDKAGPPFPSLPHFEKNI